MNSKVVHNGYNYPSLKGFLATMFNIVDVDNDKYLVSMGTGMMQSLKVIVANKWSDKSGAS